MLNDTLHEGKQALKFVELYFQQRLTLNDTLHEGKLGASCNDVI